MCPLPNCLETFGNEEVFVCDVAIIVNFVGWQYVVKEAVVGVGCCEAGAFDGLFLSVMQLAAFEGDICPDAVQVW